MTDQEPRDTLTYIRSINLDKSTKVIKWRKKSLSTNEAETTGYLYAKQILICSMYYEQIVTKNDSIDLNVKPKIIKLLEENTGEGLLILCRAKISRYVAKSMIYKKEKIW